jgi:hypothetical protein
MPNTQISPVPPLDLNDKDLQQVEQRMCTEVAMDTRDG